MGSPADVVSQSSGGYVVNLPSLGFFFSCVMAVRLQYSKSRLCWFRLVMSVWRSDLEFRFQTAAHGWSPQGKEKRAGPQGTYRKCVSEQEDECNPHLPEEGVCLCRTELWSGKTKLDSCP